MARPRVSLKNDDMINHQPTTSRARSVAEELRVASHELGHCMLRWHFGWPIKGITIERRARADGRVVNGSVFGASEISDDADRFERLVILAAGCVAEDVYLGSGRGLKGSDLRKSRLHAGQLAETECGIKLLIEAAKTEAEAVIRRYSLIFDPLIDILHERRTLPGAEIVALIERELSRWGLSRA
ncbi:hypothetical protein [Bradyrhizobium sp. SEMIA]|uniref:hypothetical protein n=1 Tax=Bradyrhizobium sp. SEMIA TaxID=2597515 RepID=UPI0018A34609|nr:hypothetical protein [Bradyrhizobium sp. SEMIA]QOG17533.1 hypothetical protein FOM02_09430 [Bradyrhizobium sp. SEMIA]